MTIIVNGTTIQAVYVNGVQFRTVYADNALVFRDADASDIINSVWSNRYAYVRQPGESNINLFQWYGDTIGPNGPFGRYTYSRSTLATFSNAGQPSLSSKSTVVVWGSSITGMSSLSSSPSPTATYGPSFSNGGQAIALYNINLDARDITSVTLNWSGNNANFGNWTGLFILPGVWSVAADRVNWFGTSIPVPANAVVIANGGGAGDICRFGNAYGLGGLISQASNWYNNYWVGLYFNLLNTASTLYTPNRFYIPITEGDDFPFAQNMDGNAAVYPNRLTTLVKTG